MKVIESYKLLISKKYIRRVFDTFILSVQMTDSIAQNKEYNITCKCKNEVLKI